MKTSIKPGDRVKSSKCGPVMTVQKYSKKYNFLIGWHEDHNSVECTWYDPKEGYKKRTFLTKNLMKAPHYFYSKPKEQNLTDSNSRSSSF